jgi:hypothetical protein
MQMESWQELANPRDLTKIFTTPEYAAWRSLRESDDARYLALCMPRFLARLPYGAKTSPVDEFDFEEDTAGATHAKYSWANAAYAMAVNVNRSFKTYGWCSRIRGIESGGAVENLPTHSFPSDDGGIDMKCPTEIAISDRREAELSKNGFLSMIHRKNSDFAAFISGQSLQKPQEYDDPDATANAALAARLPYLFACKPFRALPEVHRARQGRLVPLARSHAELAQRVDPQLRGRRSANSSEDTKAKRPLAAAQVEVEEVEGFAWLLPVQVLPQAALPARRPDGVFAAGLQATVGESRLKAHSRLTGESIMAVNAFVTFYDKADGESIQKGKEKWIEIQGWDWEVEAESSWTKGGGASVGKPNPGKLNFEHYFDTSSTVILGYICTGKAVPKLQLEMMKPPARAARRPTSR